MKTSQNTHDHQIQARVNIKEAAAILGLSVITLRRMIYRREIPFVRSGQRKIQFFVSDLEAYLNKNRISAVY